MRLLDQIQKKINFAKMRSNRQKRAPYQYSVLILGPRKQNNFSVSDFNGLDDPELKITNDTYLSPFSAHVAFEPEDNLSRLRRDDSYGSSGYGAHSYCPEGIPVETALFAITGAAALAFGILFMAITMITMMGRRRRRETSNETESPVSFSGVLSDLIYQGSHCL